MKKLFSFMMALVLVLSLSVNAFAAENTGSITITNATKGDTYRLYHIFDASYSVKDGKADSVIYSIKEDNQFFAYMFKNSEGNVVENPYFSHALKEGTTNQYIVAKKDETITDAQIISYLTEMVRSKNDDGTAKFTAVKTDKLEDEAADANLTFSNLPYGYYLIDKGVGAAVTIDSNTPDVDVIDKNQIPGTNFDKLLKTDALDEDGNPIEWASGNSASVGDMVEWQVKFTATNYDGDDIVQYYAITDEKSSPLWVEFDQIRVWVGTKELTKGYYVCAGADTVQTQEWHYLGSGWEDGLPDDKNNSDYHSHINEAEWYLVHYTYDKFEIVIPWLDDYTFTGKQDANQGYELKFDLDKNDGNTIHSDSKFSSPVDVVLTYKASVGPGAAGTTVKNSAHLDWVTAEGESGPDDPETTETKVYNLGVTKIANDGTAEQAATRLAGAVFELYKDKNCTEPVYVIPTNNTGVYILDDVDTIVSGYNRTTSREMYAGYWEDYIKESKDSKTVTYVTDKNETVTTKMRRDMVTPANGQLVILGLEAGTYYLKETAAPTGYNVLSAPQKVTVGPGGVAGTYIDPGYKDLEDKPIQFAVSKIDIVNSKGVELPSTGGEGAMKMITIGSLVAMAFAVLLITHKKMSTYHD